LSEEDAQPKHAKPEPAAPRHEIPLKKPARV